jgi:hypothetical protein
MQVNSFLGRMLVFALVLALGIFIGVDQAEKGIHEIHGPFPSQPAVETVAVIEPGVKKESSSLNQVDTQIVVPKQVNESGLSRLFSKIGSLLHLLADHLIRFLVGIGESIFT